MVNTDQTNYTSGSSQWSTSPIGRHSSVASESSFASASASGSARSSMSEPIAIIPSTPSPTSIYSPLPYPAHSLSESVSPGAVVRDGPLYDILPAFPASSSSSSYSNSFALAPNSWNASGFGSASPGRRVVSAPFAYSTSPQSPLSGGHGFLHPLDTSYPSSPTGRNSRSSTRQSYPLTSRALSPSSRLLPSPKSKRRRSVTLSTSAGASSTPFGAFVGSYENSLLTGRMSTLPSHRLPFFASIGVLGSPDSLLKLRCPPHLNVEFGVFFYDGTDGAQMSSPYVGTIDLESHYHSLLRPPSSLDNLHSQSVEPPISGVSQAPTPRRIPKFPGYRVPSRGQVQLVIKNPNATAVKLFLVPYDLTGLDRDGNGGKTFLHQKSYLVEEESDQSARRLRHAVHLQFCSPPSSSTSEPHFYLHGNVRVVFGSCALNMKEKLRVVTEGPNGPIGDGSASSTTIDFAAYRGPGAEWELARKKAKAREKLSHLGLTQPPMDSVPVAESTYAVDDDEEVDPADPDYVPDARLDRWHPSPNFARPLLLSTPPDSLLTSESPSSHRGPFEMSKLSNALSSIDFSSPVRPKRPSSASGPSGLSTSRPSSPATFGNRPLPDMEDKTSSTPPLHSPPIAGR
ncbi:hypothetical protein T439DRAFT_377075 [Meredithblackwellia eburnea MCA 4105]